MRCQNCAGRLVFPNHFKEYPDHAAALRNSALSDEEQSLYAQAKIDHYMIDNEGRYTRASATLEYLMFCEHERIPSIVIARYENGLIDVYLDLPGVYGWTEEGIEQLFTYFASLPASSFRVTLDNAAVLGLKLREDFHSFTSALYNLIYRSMSPDKLDKKTMRKLYRWQQKYSSFQASTNDMYW